MSKAPCKDCKERELGCHAKCEKYIDFKQEREQENKVEREYKEKIFIPRKIVKKRS
jgi:hypothetical protein